MESSTVLVRDVAERKPTATGPADFTDVPASATGFPAPRKRWKSSKPTPPTPQPHFSAPEKKPASGSYPTERQRIDRENRQRINDMTSEEIVQAQQDLLGGLDPALIKRLLARATLDDDQAGPSVFETETETKGPRIEPQTREPDLSFRTDHEAAATRPVQPPKRATPEEDAPPANVVPEELFPLADAPPAPAPPPPARVHFPAAPAATNLDPDDPDFLASLHQKYFPTLPADPTKLAWMAPVPTQHSLADKDSSYYPGRSSISVSALRFDFRGALIPPSMAREIHVSKGLHHHGEAPEAAGYTVKELALLARSAMPAQRCIAFQVLGRILFRLGKGEWGVGGNDEAGGDRMAMGLWEEVKEGRVLETLSEAAAVEGGHRGSRAFAVEALWLFEKGEWKTRWAGL